MMITTGQQVKRPRGAPRNAATERCRGTPPRNAATERRRGTPPRNAATERRHGTPPRNAAAERRHGTLPRNEEPVVTPVTGTRQPERSAQAPSSEGAPQVRV